MSQIDFKNLQDRLFVHRNEGRGKSTITCPDLIYRDRDAAAGAGLVPVNLLACCWRLAAAGGAVAGDGSLGRCDCDWTSHDMVFQPRGDTGRYVRNELLSIPITFAVLELALNDSRAWCSAATDNLD